MIKTVKPITGKDHLAKLTPTIESDDYTVGVQDTLVVEEPSPMFITFTNIRSYL
jgi:hypothetical protein